jgi:hypothetical protein
MGCTIPNEPLGTDYAVACGVDGKGGRAAALNGGDTASPDTVIPDRSKIGAGLISAAVAGGSLLKRKKSKSDLAGILATPNKPEAP